MQNIRKDSILVKILSNEKISLVVQKEQKTASFDLKNRIIRIPDYMYDDENFTSMVLGHEIAHCIYTPYEGWIEASRELKKDSSISDENKNYIQSVVNIIEDVRIDKLIQRKYPGLTKYYKKATKPIYDLDFFKIKEKNKDVAKMSFVNKICVYTKCDMHGTLFTYNVKFSPLEKGYLDRILQLETWDEVIAISREILQKFTMKDEGVVWDDEEAEAEAGEGSGKKNENSSNNPLAPGRMNIDDEFMSDDGEDDEGAEKQDNLSIGGLSDDEGDLLYDIWSKSLQKQVNIARSNSRIGKEGTKDIVEVNSFKTTQFIKEDRNLDPSIERVVDLAKEYNKYVNKFSIKFNQKKRARELMNTTEKDTGKIDPGRLFRYKFDDNIFSKNTIENYQKNHGFMFLIDCSSSMAEVFKSLTLQLFAFYKICERIDVPFAAYGYTDGYSKVTERTVNNFRSSVKFYKFMEKGDSRKDIYKNIELLLSGNLSMGGTPTSDALLGIVPEIKRFKNNFTPDIMNLIVITDGSDGTYMESSSLSFKGALYNNVFSPRGVVDNTAAIYELLKDFYDVRISHMDITDHIPDSLLSNDERDFFKSKRFLTKKKFGGADNVIWINENLITSKSTDVVDSLVNMLA